MKVQNISHKIGFPRFKANYRCYTDESLKNKTETNGLIAEYSELFRKDIDWLNLAEIIENNFKNIDRVNIYSLACSNGAEPYSLAIALNETSKNLDKYNPIIAIDKDPIIIDIAQKGRINISKKEKENFENIVKPKQEYFIDKGPRTIIIDEPDEIFTGITESYKVIPKIRNMIKFEVGDMLQKLLEINDNGNSVILCRNVMPYLTPAYQFNIFNVLLNNIKPNSLIILGDFDKETLLYNNIDYISSLNFEKSFTKIKNLIYKKI